MDRQSGCLCCDTELLKEGLHVESKLLVVLVDERPRCRLGGARWGASAGEEWADDVFAQHQERGDGTHAGRRELVAARATQIGDQLFGTRLLQVVSDPA